MVLGEFLHVESNTKNVNGNFTKKEVINIVGNFFSVFIVVSTDYF